MAWAPVGVDDLLKCQSDSRRALHLIDDDGQAGRRRLLRKGLELPEWISFKRGTNAVVVQRKIAAGSREVADKGCFARLARTNDVYYPAGSESPFDSPTQMSEKMCVSNVLDGFPIRSRVILLLGYQKFAYHKSRNVPIIIYGKRLARAPDYDRKRASALTRQNPRKDCLQ